MKLVRIPDLREMKGKGTKISVLTAYDATMARLLDKAGEVGRLVAALLRSLDSSRCREP